MFIRSERLFLRPGWPEDWEELLVRINDAEVVGNLARAPWPYTMADAMEFAGREQERLLPHFFITLPTADGARLIGSIGLGRDGGEIELGYWIARDWWGQGFATEAVRAMLSLAAALGHRRLAAGHFADNPASGRVLVKAGFRPTGTTRLRFSPGRGGEAVSHGYAIELEAMGADSDGDVDAGTMRAA